MKIKRAKYTIAPLGECLVDYCSEVLYGLRLFSKWSDLHSVGDQNRVFESSLFSDLVIDQLREYLAGERFEFDVQVDISHLTEFHQRVLRELQRVPYGQRRSYREIAEAVGSPRAARAVGAACNRNPIHIIIPCHRVVGANGSLVGYAAGVELKRELLSLERGVL